MSDECLILIDDIRPTDDVLADLRRILSGEKGKIIALGEPVLMMLRNVFPDCVSYHDFEREGSYEGVYDTAVKWGRRWYKCDGNDLTEVEGLSLGSTVEWSVINLFSSFLQMYVSLEDILNRVEASRVILVGPKDKPRDITECGTIGITTDRILRFLLSRDEYKGIDLKIIGLDSTQRFLSIRDTRRSAVRALAGGMNKIIGELRAKLDPARTKRPGIVFFEGAHHFRPLFVSGAFRDYDLIHLQKTIGLSLAKELYSAGVRVVPLDRIKPKKIMNMDSRAGLDPLDRAPSGAFHFRGRDLLPCFREDLEAIYKGFLARSACYDLSLVSSALEEISPGCVVTENDTTYYERMIVLAAKRLGIPTIVLQHGSTFYGKACNGDGLACHAFIPITADRFFAYGEATCDWFRNMGAPANRVVATGSPRFDVYYRERTAGERAGRKKVMLALTDVWVRGTVPKSHTSLCVFFEQIKVFMKVACGMKDVDFIVRPQDTMNRWKDLFRRELEDCRNVTISKKGSMQEVLKDIDVVVGHTTTALIEAVICKIPVISLDIGEFTDAVPLWKYGCSARVSSYEELRDILGELLTNPAVREDLVEKAYANIQMFNYGNDGKATERVAREIIETVKRGVPVEKSKGRERIYA